MNTDLNNTIFGKDPPKVKYKKGRFLTLKKKDVTREGGYMEIDDLSMQKKSSERSMNEKEKQDYYENYTMKRRYTTEE